MNIPLLNVSDGDCWLAWWGGGEGEGKNHKTQSVELKTQWRMIY